MVRLRPSDLLSAVCVLLFFVVQADPAKEKYSIYTERRGGGGADLERKKLSPIELVVVKTPLDDRDDHSPPQCEVVMRDDNVYGPLVPCEFLDEQFVECDPPRQYIPPSANSSKGIPGCTRFGGQRYESVERTNVTCRVLPCIECRGARSFEREVPCIKFTGHHFLSTLLYSIFLGVLAVDRFCLGYSAIAVGKLMTLGGLGVWWIVDIVLLVTGNLTPADDSNWEPYF